MKRSFPVRVARRVLTPFKQAVTRVGLAVASRGRWCAGLFYAVTGGMSWEQRAVVAGRLSGRKRSSSPARLSAVRYRVRRGTHRLEKGLITTPFRTPYALNYISDLVRDAGELASAAGASGADESTMAWACGVLDAYFDANLESQHPVVLAAHRGYEKFRHRLSGEITSRCRPFVRTAEACPVSYESLLSLARRRRSVRHYLPRPVPHDAIDRAIALGLEAPSGCNRQPFRFRVFDDPALVSEVAQLPPGCSGFGGAIPCLIVIVGEMSAFAEDRDRHLAYIDASLAAMGVQLALETQGLSSCSINWPAISEREAMMRRTLNLRRDEQVVMLLSVGYPDPDHPVPGSSKKLLDEMRTFNQR